MHFVSRFHSSIRIKLLNFNVWAKLFGKLEVEFDTAGLAVIFALLFTSLSFAVDIVQNHDTALYSFYSLGLHF